MCIKKIEETDKNVFKASESTIFACVLRNNNIILCKWIGYVWDDNKIKSYLQRRPDRNFLKSHQQFRNMIPNI